MSLLAALNGRDWDIFWDVNEDPVFIAVEPEIGAHSLALLFGYDTDYRAVAMTWSRPRFEKAGDGIVVYIVIVVIIVIVRGLSGPWHWWRRVTRISRGGWVTRGRWDPLPGTRAGRGGIREWSWNRLFEECVLMRT